jgi:hypothetical protein
VKLYQNKRLWILEIIAIFQEEKNNKAKLITDIIITIKSNYPRFALTRNYRLFSLNFCVVYIKNMKKKAHISKSEQLI